MGNPALDSDPNVPKAPSDPSREQRRHPRFELAVRCWITDSRHTLYLRVHDISKGGLSVRAPVPFAPTGKIEVGLELPGGRRVRAHGEVVWVARRQRRRAAREWARGSSSSSKAKRSSTSSLATPS